MRFSIIAALTFGASAIASPIVARQDGVIGALSNDIAELTTSINTDLSAIDTAFAKGETDVENIIKSVAVNGAHLLYTILCAADEIAASTETLITALTAPEIKALISTIQTVETLVESTIKDLEAIGAQFETETEKVLLQEIKAIEAALKPFVDPLVAYAHKISNTDLAPLVNDLETAASSLENTLGSLLKSVLGI